MAPLSSLFGSSSALTAALATMGKPQEQQPAALVPAKAVTSALPATVIAASAAEGVKLYTPAYYWTCAAGGVASCGLTHMGVTPLDVVKCNMQTDPKNYTGE